MVLANVLFRFISLSFVSFLFDKFRFGTFQFVSFHFDLVWHFTGTPVCSIKFRKIMLDVGPRDTVVKATA
jgi:hypothetical protein